MKARKMGFRMQLEPIRERLQVVGAAVTKAEKTTN